MRFARLRHVRCIAAVCALLAACAGAARIEARIPENDLAFWQRELGAFGSALFLALREDQLERVLVPRRDLDAWLTGEGRARVERERELVAASLSRAQVGSAWQEAEYLGLCAQGVHEEAPRTSYGLRVNSWVVDRLLVVAQRGRSRSATWVEGRFVYTNQGFRALSVSRIEPPRSHHTDLELAPCDVEVGIR